MKVTKVFFRRHTANNSLKAFADVEFDGEMIVPGFTIFEGDRGAWAKVPQRQDGEKYWPILRWSDKAFYEKDSEPHPILQQVLERWEAYKKYEEKNSSKPKKTENGNPW